MIVEVKNLIKRYKELIALDNLSFSISEKSIFGLLGPNGSGKTTAINCILSILKSNGGEVFIFGDKMNIDRDDIKKRIGVVPQEIAVFDDLSVYDNIKYFAGLYLVDKKNIESYVDEAIEFVKLDKYRKFKAKKLSGGLKRRLNIAMGIVHKPELIFMDEPTVAVDAQSREFILEGIKNLKNNGATVIYTTHYLQEAEDICDNIVIIDQGKKIAEGSVDELKEMVIKNQKINIEVDTDEDLSDKFLNIKDVMEVVRNNKKYTILLKKNSSSLSRIIEYLENSNIAYLSLYVERPTLTDVFLELTGKELREK